MILLIYFILLECWRRKSV